MPVTDWPVAATSLIRQAVLAPSSHNTQPWTFRVGTTRIDLCADRTRALPANDPHDRELSISCGCALLNLRAAAAHAGFDVGLELLPDLQQPDWLARVALSRSSATPAAEAALAPFIERRRTYRKRFAPREVERSSLDVLTRAASSEGAWLRPLLTDDARHEAASLVAEGDAIQWADPVWRRELAAWMHPRRRGDGLTVAALATPVAQVVIRSFDMGGGVGAKDRELAEGSPLLAVLGTADDGPRSWLQAGMALERVALEACRHGLQASFLNQPVQVSSLRTRLQRLVGDGWPQIVFRFGHPLEELPATPRRPVEEVLEWERA